VIGLAQSRTPAGRFAAGRRGAVLDAIGTLLISVAGVWILWTSALSGGSAVPGIELLLACGVLLLGARIIGSHVRLLVPMAVLAAAVIVAVRSTTGILSTAPLSGPLRYINADGAFYVQAAIAGLMVVSGARSWVLRFLGGLAAVVFGVLPFIVHALAAALLVVALPGISLVSAALGGASGARAAVALFGLLFIGSLAATIWLGGTYSASEPDLFQRAAASAVDEHRLVLWHDAFVIMQDHPGTGVGPRRYQVVSPIASKDPDSRWAHNEFLQQGAEGGIVGLVLLAALFIWGFSRLRAVGAASVVTTLGAASLAALGIHACVDYVMHFPAVSLTAAALVGTGMIQERLNGGRAAGLRNASRGASR
jgi:hypothetical protein